MPYPPVTAQSSYIGRPSDLKILATRSALPLLPEGRKKGRVQGMAALPLARQELTHTHSRRTPNKVQFVVTEAPGLPVGNFACQIPPISLSRVGLTAYTRCREFCLSNSPIILSLLVEFPLLTIACAGI